MLFTLIGFLGMYTVLSLLYIFLMLRRIDTGADELTAAAVGFGSPIVAGDVSRTI